jgi:membrane protein implicated in regulation of membrane protease activity
MADRFGVVLPSTLAFLVPLQLGDVLGVGLPLLLLLAGTGLIVAEALAPGAHFIVLGIALFLAGGIGFLASGTALAVLASPLGLTGMVLVFSVATFLAYSRFDIYGGGSGGKTTDSDSLRGQIGRVTENVTSTEGEVKLEDGGFNPYFSARSVDGSTISEGTEVVVVDPGGGNVVEVQSTEASTVDEIDRELTRSSRSSTDTSTDDAATPREREKETE